ncbi:MAG: imidazole glycerol phosphate synthase subunit HisH [Cyclobacteriaceae bacterium]|jgi:glutamine amidotransferase
MVVIVDYGVGNLMAIQNIIRKVGGESVVSSEPEIISQAHKLILPGVGAFGYCAQQLKSRNLIPVLQQEVLQKKKLVLGLCVGAQLMTSGSEESPEEGLGWVSARTVKFNMDVVPIVPHMGWRDVHFNGQLPLSKGFEEGARFYFVHSYHFQFSRPEEVLATAHYGYDFACAFQKENILGVQFHPEKSHRFGMKLFENFLEI